MALLFISRSSALLTGAAGGTATAAETAVAVLGAAAVFVALYFLFRKLCFVNKDKESPLRPVSDVLAAGYLALSASISLASLASAVTRSDGSRGMTALGLIALVTITAAYAAYKGLEGSARACALVLAALGALAALILAANAPNLERANLRAAIIMPDTGLLAEFCNILLCPEIALIYALRSRVSRKAGRERVSQAALFFLCAQAALFALFAAAEEAVFGAIRPMLANPMLALASVAEFELARRLDTLFAALLLAAGALRAAVYIIAALALSGSECGAKPVIGVAAAVALCAFAALSLSGGAFLELRAVAALALVAMLVCASMSVFSARYKKSKGDESRA